MYGAEIGQSGPGKATQDESMMVQKIHEAPLIITKKNTLKLFYIRIS